MDPLSQILDLVLHVDEGEIHLEVEARRNSVGFVTELELLRLREQIAQLLGMPVDEIQLVLESL